MIFVSYEPGSKGYQFWDTAHRRFDISHDVKFEETQFPARETLLVQPTLAPSSDQAISSSDINHDDLGLDLFKLAQPPTRPPSPGLSTPSQLSTSSHPLLGEYSTPPYAETAPQARQPHPVPHYSLQPTKAHQERQQQAGTSQEGINSCLIYMFQEAPNSHWEAMTSPDKEKWLEVSQEEFNGLTEMGVWRLVDRPSNHKTIKCRWTYMLKSNG